MITNINEWRKIYENHTDLVKQYIDLLNKKFKDIIKFEYVNDDYIATTVLDVDSFLLDDYELYNDGDVAKMTISVDVPFKMKIDVNYKKYNYIVDLAQILVDSDDKELEEFHDDFYNKTDIVIELDIDDIAYKVRNDVYELMSETDYR